MKQEHIHLIGIGGTGMAALAGLLKESGVRVTGSDAKLYPPMSTILEEMSVEVKNGFRTENLKPHPDMAVIGNIVKRGNEEAEYVLDNRIEYRSMPELIKERFLRGKHSVVVAGTHGKTTTASLLAWIFHRAGRDAGFLVGGIPKNFMKNYHFGSGDHFIVEGDEYETAFFDKGPKFMHYMPHTLVLGSIEYDHADIFKSLDEILLQFKRLVNIVPRSGRIVCCWESKNIREVVHNSFSRVESFGFGPDPFWRISSMETTSSKDRKNASERGSQWTEFDLYRESRFLKRFRINIPGRFNVLNATAAIAASLGNSIDLDTVSEALESFEGTKRRFEVIGTYRDITVIDDFAHHPTAIRETLQAARERYSCSRIWAVFEPRSWSLRRNVFENDLAASFLMADEIIIAPVYGAEQLPASERLNVDNVIKELRRNGKSACTMKEGVDGIIKKLIEELDERDVVIIMSNGSFDNLYGKLLDKLSRT
ncbi:MAG: UDP-N-acetylmuramate:L-alanyl-gamma-D-glutamyl-meso-diaminopimelate ligase [Acidobacteriota bacterium]